MNYVIIYMSVPLDAPDDEAAPNEFDAQTIGEHLHAVIEDHSHFEGVELLGTRLTRNNLVAPAINRLEVP